jgi:anti-sigma regulatory factor (Ser/Thr protein kinase)
MRTTPETEDGFRHEALFYAGEDEFVSGAANFLLDGVRDGEPALVVVSARKIDLLRKRLKADAGKILFADMGEVGTNPARIIPAWSDFVNEHEGRARRGIGEPIWAQRSPDELVECQWHESLLNVAFADSAGFRLMCPYDTSALDRDVVEEAGRSHPFLVRDGGSRRSDRYPGTEAFDVPFSTPLPPPPTSSVDLLFEAGAMSELRSLVASEAMEAGLGGVRAEETVAAVNELASNSVRHGGGGGVLRMWMTADSFICEVSDGGHIDEPLVGRRRPRTDMPGGRGLWMVNQLCELVQVRTGSEGTTVRVHVRRQPA